MRRRMPRATHVMLLLTATEDAGGHKVRLQRVWFGLGERRMEDDAHAILACTHGPGCPSAFRSFASRYDVATRRPDERDFAAGGLQHLRKCEVVTAW